MNTKLLPIAAALLSAVSLTAQANNDIQDNGNAAYVTDSYGNIVRDSWGECTRSINWTAETAIASCENGQPASSTTTSSASSTAAAPVAPVNDVIKDNGQRGYAIDSNGNVVRDSWGRCVRTIEWTPETEIARCEGKEEVVIVEEVAVVPEPEPVVAVVAPVIAPAPVVKPAPKTIPTIAAFRGFFDTNSAILKSSAKHDLDIYADFMKANPETRIRITGHTDSTGEASYNQQLSEKRANAAKAYLVKKGIAEDRMETHGAGETSPISDNSTRDGRAHNRRVEVELIK